MKREVRVGNVLIGGNNPVSLQSMSNIDTCDVNAVLNQIDELYYEGCQIMRLAVYDYNAAKAFGEIKKKSKLPLVADIHFDYKLALESIKNGADKIRINPGNIGGEEALKKVVIAAKEREIPIRVGVNGGSLEKDIYNKYKGVTADAIVESAVRNVSLLEDMDFTDIVVSLKASDPRLNFDAYRKFSEISDYPLHIGVTEAGSMERGIIKSSVGIGALLMLGIGDTMRVSLTGDPIQEIRTGKMILSSSGIKKESVDVVSCPTCGRTGVDLDGIVKEVESAFSEIRKYREEKGLNPITVAVMGCEVNGPGEAKSADLGVACGKGRGAIFLKGKVVETVEEKRIKDTLLAYARDMK